MKSFALKLQKLNRVILSNRMLAVGTYSLLFLVLVCILAPVIAPYDPYYYGPESLAGLFSQGHILGTNKLGQDILSMIIYGTRTSLEVAFISSMISALIGIMIGGISGYIGGRVDMLVSEFNNIFMMLPTFFLILLIVATFGNNILNVMIVIGITTWPSNAKLMRSQALSTRERVYVKSAYALGEKHSQILFKYIIPSGIFAVIANTTLGMSNAILTEASLSFLGLGDPTIVSWGQMINDGKSYLTSAWWISVFPGIAIIFTVISFYFIGDGLNKLLDPKKN